MACHIQQALTIFNDVQRYSLDDDVHDDVQLTKVVCDHWTVQPVRQDKPGQKMHTSTIEPGISR